MLGLFGKRPDPGRVKTRLAAEFGPRFAADAHEAMLLDLLEAWDRQLAPGGRRVLAFAPDDAGPWFDARVPASFALQAQADGDLGRRMHAFFAGEFEDGATRAVLIGSDSPTLDPSLVIGAFLCLEQKDLVLGYRLHGNLMALANGTPSIYFTYDSRTVEFAETYQIPSFDVFSGREFRLEEYWDQSLFDKFNRAYHHTYREMRQFLVENGVDTKMVDVMPTKSAKSPVQPLLKVA